jgi:hypothetical protein
MHGLGFLSFSRAMLRMHVGEIRFLIDKQENWEATAEILLYPGLACPITIPIRRLSL